MANARYGDDLVDHFTYVIAGDGCLMEGISQEAISLAGHLRLGRLIVLFDDNGISIDGPTSLATSMTSSRASRRPAGRSAVSTATIPRPLRRRSPRSAQSTKPSLIACRTIIGYGAPDRQGTEKAQARRSAPSEIGGGARGRSAGTRALRGARSRSSTAWRMIGQRGAGRALAWLDRYACATAAQRELFIEGKAVALPDGLCPGLGEIARALCQRASEGGDAASLATGARRHRRRRFPDWSAARPT